MKYIVSLLVIGFVFTGCSNTFEGAKKDSKIGWEKTKEVSSKAWSATKEGASDAYEATKNTVKNISE